MAPAAPLLRRSELATPATSDRMFDRAAASGADLVFLDLEDAVAPARKVEARSGAVAALTGRDWGSTVRAVRVNGLHTPWAHGDVVEVLTGAVDALDTLILPKVTSARDVWWFDVLLTQLEAQLGRTRPVRLEVLIEDVAALAAVEEIAVASPRLDALIFGAGDFSVSVGARVDTNFAPLGDYPGDFWHYARCKVLAAARIGGLVAVDAPYPDYGDTAGYTVQARRAGLLGYTGKWAIHPSQVPIANEVYAPTAQEVARAERDIAAYRDGEARGLGAVGVGGVLVDAAHVTLSQAVLARARAVAERATATPAVTR